MVKPMICPPPLKNPGSAPRRCFDRKAVFCETPLRLEENLTHAKNVLLPGHYHRELKLFLQVDAHLQFMPRW